MYKNIYFNIILALRLIRGVLVAAIDKYFLFSPWPTESLFLFLILSFKINDLNGRSGLVLMG